MDIINIALIKEKKNEEKESKSSSPVYIEGSDIEGVKFARCCTPIPGDRIVAVASNSGITVHCSDCVNLKQIAKDRCLSAEWKDNIAKNFDISLRIVGKDQYGILSDITNVFYDRGTKMNTLSAKMLGEGKFEVLVNLVVQDNVEAESLINEIEKIEKIYFVNRNNLN